MERRVFPTIFSNIFFILSRNQLAGLIGDPEADRWLAIFFIEVGSLHLDRMSRRDTQITQIAPENSP